MLGKDEYIKKQLLQSAETKLKLADKSSADIARAAEICFAAIKSGGKIMFCGNGGSAADSQHLATELVVRLSSTINRSALPALALTTDSSILTACGNDFGFEYIFSRQIEALGGQGDVLIGISTSGNSPNVINAVHIAKEKKIATIALLGKDGGKLRAMVDVPLLVPSDDVQHIQEAHIAIGHIIIGLIEKVIVGNG
jgi:D-sedoheptulose 7-phosphate isomerase